MKSVIKSLALIAVGIVFLSAAPAMAVVPPVSGEAMWLDATNVDGTNNSSLSNGSAISQWDDLSGNGFNVLQATSAKKPTLATGVLNGLPVVRFDGVNDDLIDTTGAPYTGAVHTVFIVLKAPKPATEQDIFDGDPNGLNFRVTYADANGLHIYRGTGGGGDIANPNYTAGQYLIFASVWDGTSSAIYINGANQVTGPMSTSTLVPSSVYVGSNADANSFFNGDLAEVLVYNSDLTLGGGADFNAVESYLEVKWLPEPASLSLVVVGGAALLRRRRV